MVRVFGPEEWAVRLPSAILGLIGALLLERVIRRGWGQPAGHLAGAFAALFPPLVAASRAATVEPTLVTLGLFALIVLTHVLTALLAIGVLAALTVAGMLRRPSLVVTTTLLFLGWQVYVAAPFYGFYGPNLVAALLAAPDFLTVNLANRIAGSPAHESVATLRVATAVVAFALGALGVARFLVRRPIPRETRFAIVALLGIAILAPISVYGGEMLIRVLLFSLPMLAILIVRAFDAAAVRVALIAALVVFAPLQLVTHYGNELYDYVSPGEVAGFSYVADHLAPANVDGAYPAGVFLRSATLDYRNTVPPNASAVFHFTSRARSRPPTVTSIPTPRRTKNNTST
jgi:hypothetical protein